MRVRNKEELEKELKTINNNLPNLVLLIGLPGSGKSTLSELFVSKGYDIISSDGLRTKLAGDKDNFDKDNEIFDLMGRTVVNDIANGVNCVVDATNLGYKRRGKYTARLAQAHLKGKYNLIQIFIGCDLPILRDRVAIRDADRADYLPPHRMYEIINSTTVLLPTEINMGKQIIYSPDDHLVKGYKTLDSIRTEMMRTRTLSNPVYSLWGYGLELSNRLSKSKTAKYSNYILETVKYIKMGELWRKTYNTNAHCRWEIPTALMMYARIDDLLKKTKSPSYKQLLEAIGAIGLHGVLPVYKTNADKLLNEQGAKIRRLVQDIERIEQEMLEESRR